LSAVCSGARRPVSSKPLVNKAQERDHVRE
jgi:hypothetical protein